MTPRQPPAGFVVREAAAADAELLATFACSTGAWFEDEVEAFVRERALPAALRPGSGHRLRLVLDDERLAACFAHHPERLVVAAERGTPARPLEATRLQLVALSLADQGRRLDDGRRISDLVMASCIADAIEHRSSAILTAIVARDNLRSLALCQRHGLRSQVAYDARHVRLSGRSALQPADRRRTVRPMATWDDVGRLAMAMPEAEERESRGMRQWRVKERLFVWERPLRRSDLEALGAAAPDGPILGARVEHLGAKEALVADPSGVFFTTPHFDGSPAILVRLDAIDVAGLEEVVVEAWLARAPPRLVDAYLAAHRPPAR